MKTFLRATLFVGIVFTGMELFAADWPQYRGPAHDGSTPEKISTRWPAAGPEQLWKIETPAGFSSFSVSDRKAFTQVARNIEGVPREVCIAVDAKTGKELWAYPVGFVKYGHDGGNAGSSDNKGGDGPRSTPTVDGDRVYVMSSDLTLFCLNVADGKKIWSRDLMKEHAGRNISWKNAASPLLDGDLIFVAGGGEGEALLGIRTKDGSVAWKGEDDMMTHATPVAATILEQRQIIFFTQAGLVSVMPESGKVLWRYKFPFRTSTAASPVVCGDIVFCSAGYGVGAGAVKINKSGSTFSATELWRKQNQLINHWSTPVHKDGYLYGMFSFKQYDRGPLKCIEVATGKEMWEQPGFGPGNVVLVDGNILALGDRGQLVLTEGTPEKYNELARAKVVEGKCWSTPVVSGGRAYVRSTTEGVCLDVSVKLAE
ncbi:MAG: PQQ-binding-like beta-propeller repeat protein [Verrucomicrobia bacterium]|nr:PQQ-binding-like beta-propeller repeat protein [Verrucomicrobiota bacterium]